MAITKSATKKTYSEPSSKQQKPALAVAFAVPSATKRAMLNAGPGRPRAKRS